jgi:heme/copper-type cytochrome/quinol oxidase subunit 2
MYLTDVVWWTYTAFVVGVALFLLWFAFKVRAKGG